MSTALKWYLSVQNIYLVTGSLQEGSSSTQASALYPSSGKPAEGHHGWMLVSCSDSFLLS